MDADEEPWRSVRLAVGMVVLAADPPLLAAVLDWLAEQGVPVTPADRAAYSADLAADALLSTLFGDICDVYAKHGLRGVQTYALNARRAELGLDPAP